MTERKASLLPQSIGWFSKLAQKIKKGDLEDKSLSQKFNDIRKINKQLCIIVKKLGLWRGHMKALYKMSIQFGKVVENQDSHLRDVTNASSLYIRDKEAINEIREIISKLDKLLVQKDVLKYLKTELKHSKQKLAQAQKQPVTEVSERQVARYSKIIQDTREKRKDILNQTLPAIDRIIGVYQLSGLVHLIRPQLQMFQMSQYKMFFSISSMFRGKTDEVLMTGFEKKLMGLTDDFADQISERVSYGVIDDFNLFLEGVFEEVEEAEKGSNGSQKRCKDSMPEEAMWEVDEEYYSDAIDSVEGSICSNRFFS